MSSLATDADLERMDHCTERMLKMYDDKVVVHRENGLGIIDAKRQAGTDVLVAGLFSMDDDIVQLKSLLLFAIQVGRI